MFLQWKSQAVEEKVEIGCEVLDVNPHGNEQASAFHREGYWENLLVVLKLQPTALKFYT